MAEIRPIRKLSVPQATAAGRIRVAEEGFTNAGWRPVNAKAVSANELTLESVDEPVTLVLRRAWPAPDSVVFLDAFGGGRMLTRHQLLRRRSSGASGAPMRQAREAEGGGEDAVEDAARRGVGKRDVAASTREGVSH